MASFPFGSPGTAMSGANSRQFAPPPPAASSASNPDDDELVDAIERILSAEENRKIQAASPSACREGNDPIALSHGGPFTGHELSILSLLCIKASGQDPQGTVGRDDSRGARGFAAVDGDLLSTLNELLEKHVNLAVGIDLVQEAVSVIHKREVKIDQWIRNGGPGGNRVAALRLGLEAASILLFIVSSPGVENRVASEDAIATSFLLLRHNLSKNVLPALNNSGHLLAAEAAEEEKGTTSPRKRRKRTSGGGENNPVVRDLKKVYKHILNLMDLHLQLMERCDAALQTLFVDDQQILTLTSGALIALEIESSTSSQSPAHALQIATIRLVTAVFRKFPMHRGSIMDELFPLMLKIPSHKRNMRTFPVRFSSSPGPKRTQELTTALFSEMLANGRQPHYIQMMTALILSIIGSCITRPSFAAPDRSTGNRDDIDSEGDVSKESQPRTKFVSGLRISQSVADMCAIQLLQRCSRKGEDGGASEFRPILVNLVEDLLLILMIPEYPAAQMLLMSCTNVLSRDVLIASQATNTNTDKVVESTYINTAFDTLGRICAAYAKILAAQRQREFPTTTIMVPEDRRLVRCYCKENEWTDTLMVDCDRCHIWYHAQCIGMNREILPNQWFCDKCTLQIVMEEERSNYGDSDACRNLLNPKFAMNQILETHLRSAMGFDVAARFHLAKWTEELERDGIASGKSAKLGASRQVVARIIERWDGFGPNVASRTDDLKFSEEGGIRALLTLTTSYSNFMKSFNGHMGLILKLMSDKAHASLRKLSVKAIEKVVEADPKLMLLNKVMNVVSQRLSDESISVREAVVSLVGGYVVTSPALANAFHQHLIPRLLDPGVSVRKRTVKILQDILFSNAHYRGRADACDKCLQRAADPKEDEGVREALHSLFMKLWLEKGDICIAPHYDKTPVKDGMAPSPSKSSAGSVEEPSPASGIVTPTPPVDGRATRSKQKQLGKRRSELAAEQMVAAVKIAGTNENLSNFMRELLCNVHDSDKGKKAAERRKRQKVAETQCYFLVDALFEILLSTEERRQELGNDIGAELVAIIRTIVVFAEIATSSVLKHLRTILPYLKADNGLSLADESALASAACDIVYQLVPILDYLEMQRLSNGSLGEDLVKITYKFGSGALYSATRTLCILAHHRDAGELNIFGKKLMDLAMTFYAYLHKKESTESFTDSATKNNVQRLLSGLGAFCRHHEVQVDPAVWDEEVDEDNDLFAPADLTWGNVPVACFRLFSKYLGKPDVAIQCSSLRALSGIFVQHPRLMLASAQSGLIDNVMSPQSPIELQMESLRCWRDISLAEEKRIDSGEAKKKMDSKQNITTSKKISGDQDGDSTLVGGVLTKQSARLFEMTQAEEDGLRMTSLELLSQLLRQGLVNPNEAVPYLLALQGDIENMVVRRCALSLLITEGEKRPDMLRQRVCAGIKQACKFQREVYPSKEVSALIKIKKGHRIEYESVFDDLFRECFASSRKQKEGLYRRLLGMFERSEEPNDSNGDGNGVKKKKTRSRRSSGSYEEVNIDDDISLLSFAAQVLAYLPYNTYGDPLFIQHHITSIVALQGPQLQDKLAAFLRSYGLSSSDEFDETNAGEDALELAAKSNAPSRTKEAKPLTSGKFDWPQFVQLCKEASAMTLLLRLKGFLRKRYNLSEARCLEYNPDAKDRNVARGVMSRVDTMPFDASITSVSADNLIHGDEDRLIHHYASFRKLMREEARAEEEAIDMVDSDLEMGLGDDPLLDMDDKNVVEDAEDGEAKERRKDRRSSASGSSTKKRRRSSTGSVTSARKGPKRKSM